MSGRKEAPPEKINPGLLADTNERRRPMGELAILDRQAGDLKVIWDPANDAEVKAAKEQFTKLRKAGHLAYTVNSEGKKGTQITAFDPKAEKIILAPALRGG